MSCIYTVYMCLIVQTWLAGKSISFIALIAFTGEASVCVGARGISITWFVKDTLIYVCICMYMNRGRKDCNLHCHLIYNHVCCIVYKYTLGIKK